MSKPLYKRILLKISGEGLMGEQGFGIDSKKLNEIVREIKQVHNLGVEVCLVVGGGNIFRGISGEKIGIERTTGDHMGMLATIINALALQSALEKENINTRVQSAISMDAVCEPYIRRRALRHMEKNRIVIFAAGTGNPYFTTDTGATLRAVEMNCDVLIKATQVSGVYSDDPRKNPNAELLKNVSWKEVLDNRLGVMDIAAFAMAESEKLKIIVCNMHEPDALLNVVKGNGDFTLVSEVSSNRNWKG